MLVLTGVASNPTEELATRSGMRHGRSTGELSAA
ncbi:hypothetical protein BOSE62_80002 [Bosea sp. 62]|nr:hypothetical protein BOSE125_290002 [Bosea sp. 125]VXC94844.1 hypothetical protein BOSE62_80002 [Bosea sp. 62]